MSGLGATSGVKDGELVVGEGKLGLGWDAYVGSGVRVDEGGRGDGRYGGGYRLNRWEDTVANAILGTESNNILAYHPVLEIYQPIMSTLEGYGVRLYIYI